MTPVRIYPQTGGAPHTSLAAQMLGFVNASGVGQYGLEQKYDSILAGRPETVQVDPNKPGPTGWKVLDPGLPGQDIRTTIDAGLQLQVEQEVFATWLADRAQAVSAMVMDPKTGALLAEASYPSYDANEYQDVANQNPARFTDPNISDTYEPGSVFKLFTASAALQTGTTSLSTQLNDTGILKLAGGQEVADADRKATGMRTFADIVAYSRNVGVTKAAFRLGQVHRRRLQGSLPDLADLRHRAEDRHRPRGRGGRLRSRNRQPKRPGIRSTSPTAPSARRSGCRRSSS